MSGLRILYHHRIRAEDGQAAHVRELITALREAGHELRECALVPKGMCRGFESRLRYHDPGPAFGSRCSEALRSRASTAHKGVALKTIIRSHVCGMVYRPRGSCRASHSETENALHYRLLHLDLCLESNNGIAANSYLCGPVFFDFNRDVCYSSPTNGFALLRLELK